VFNFSADRVPVIIILLFSVLDFFVFFTASSIWFFVAYWLVMIIPKGVISAWNHHHQHRNVFKNVWLNRILEFFYALHTGATTNLWVLHHNFGHHRNFLDQDKDQSRWKRKDGSTKSKFGYSLEVAVTSYARGFEVGKDYPKQQKDFLIFSNLTLLILLGLAFYNPVATLFVFILPMIGSLIYTSWATYGHHVGLDTSDEFSASHNNMSRWYNILTGNLGYHTAHHHKQGVHWSELPALHEKIKDKIPAECYNLSFFERLVTAKQH
jgi:fatty acid desaturase